jgi:hypothetical protein
VGWLDSCAPAASCDRSINAPSACLYHRDRPSRAKARRPQRAATSARQRNRSELQFQSRNLQSALAQTDEESGELGARGIAEPGSSPHAAPPPHVPPSPPRFRGPQPPTAHAEESVRRAASSYHPRGHRSSATIRSSRADCVHAYCSASEGDPSGTIRRSRQRSGVTQAPPHPAYVNTTDVKCVGVTDAPGNAPRALLTRAPADTSNHIVVRRPSLVCSAWACHA